MFGQQGPPQLLGWTWTSPPTAPTPAHIPSFCPLSRVLFLLVGVSSQARSWPGTVNSEYLWRTTMYLAR